MKTYKHISENLIKQWGEENIKEKELLYLCVNYIRIKEVKDFIENIGNTEEKEEKNIKIISEITCQEIFIELFWLIANEVFIPLEFIKIFIDILAVAIDLIIRKTMKDRFLFLTYFGYLR